MPVLPPGALAGDRPETSDAAFDRRLHWQRKHFSSSFSSSLSSSSPTPSPRSGTELPLFPTKTRARFEPEYPRPSQTRHYATRDRSGDIPVAGKKTFSAVNAESLREGMFSVQPEGAPTNIPCVAKVRDPATGALVRLRRGVELDFLKTCGVSHINRVGGDYNDMDSVLARRGGLGFSSQLDRNFRTVEMSNNFFSDKPGRWWTDPDGRPVRVAFVGTKNIAGGGARGQQQAPGEISSSAAPNRAGPTQLQANAAALLELRAAASRS